MNNLINKETISELAFQFADVLEKKDDQQKRLEKLKTAMVLGNGFKHKVKVIFRDLQERRVVETTIWFVSDSHVTLKSGLVMPISCIEDVLLS